MGEDTLTRSMSRPLEDFPEQAEFLQDNGYTLAEEVEEATGPPRYEYLDEEGQKVLLNVSMYCYVYSNLTLILSPENASNYRIQKLIFNV